MNRALERPSLRLVSVSVLLLGAVFVAGCRRGDESGSRDAPARRTASSADAAASTTGTLTLGSDRYAFQVTRCDLGGSEDSDHPTLYGTGTTSGGTSFEVFAERTEAGRLGLTHSVSFQAGDVLQGDGTVWEAQRRHASDGRWSSMNTAADAPDGPLVEIHGRAVTASGTFVNDETGEQRPGRLEARCP